jgi:hypothetical protein
VRDNVIGAARVTPSTKAALEAATIPFWDAL